MNPIERDIKALVECNSDRKSFANAKAIYIPRAIRHHSAIVRTARSLGKNDPFYKVFMNDANNVRLAVSNFNKRRKSLGY